MSFISIPMGWILKWLSGIFGGSFTLSVFFFTCIVNIAILPLTIKSQKSSAKQSMLKPKLDALKQKYGDDKVKYNQAMQELYQRENVSLSGGCLPMIIRLVFVMAVYYAVIDPLQYLGGIKADVINQAMKDLNLNRAIDLVKHVTNGEVAAIPADALSHINFNFFGINLIDTPHFSFNFSEAKPIWVIPFLAFAAALLTSIISLVIQKKTSPDQPSMIGMMLIAPLITLGFSFTFPGAVGFYWACSSLVSGLLQALIQIWYSPAKLAAKEQMKFVMKRNEGEEKIKNKLA